MAPPKLVVGARVVLYVNGQMFGQVSGFQWSSTVVQKPIFALDSSSAYELVPTQARVVGSIQVYKVLGDGGAQGQAMTTQFQDVVRQRYFTLALVERTVGVILFEAGRCAFAGESWNAPVRGFVTGSINFEALEWENEVPSAPA